MPFLPFLPDLPLKINNKFRVANSFTQLVSNIRPVSMKKLKCKHCPIPGCHSKFLVRLANHLTQAYELSEIERKYWLQFAKLQIPMRFVRTLIYRKKILLGSASLSYTRIALVFCNFAILQFCNFVNNQTLRVLYCWLENNNNNSKLVQ